MSDDDKTPDFLDAPTYAEAEARCRRGCDGLRAKYAPETPDDIHERVVQMALAQLKREWRGPARTEADRLQ